MPGRNIAPLAALTLLLAAPAAASAATYEVDPTAAEGCAGTTCKTIGAALAKAGAGDKISIKRGLYEETGLDVAKDNVTLEGAPGAVAITSKGSGADVLKVSGNGVTLRGLTVGVQREGGSAVTITGANTTIETTSLAKQSAGAAVPALEILAPSGITTLRGVIVVNSPGSGGAPAIQGPSAAGLVLEASQAVSGAGAGPAVHAPGPSNKISTSGLLALNADSDALRVTSAADSSSGKSTTVDSTVLGGGANAAGLRAESIAGGLSSGSDAGDINVAMTHVTIAGAPRSVVIDAKADGRGLSASPKGSIAVTAARSIVHGAAVVENHDADPLGLFSAGNTASLTISESDTDVQPFSESGSSVAVSGATNTPDSALFADPAKRLYLLRHDAPVRDKGGAIRAGEGDKDVEGEPRLEGAATDLGADEWHNKAPVARLKVPAQVPQGTTVTIDASGSSDPEAAYGGGIKEYYFDFGDGSETKVSTSPRVEHAYPEVGSYRIRVAVVDTLGLVGAPAAATLQVTDGIAPIVKFAQPKAKSTFALKATKRVKGKDGKVRTVKVPRTFRFQGTAQDASGVDFVDLSFSFGRPSGRTCRYLDPKKNAIVGRPCGKPIFFRVALRDGIWAYRTKLKTKLRVGSYLVTARATDKSGVQGTDRLRLRLK